MLVRAFRVTDRLGNALLRVAAWAALAAVEQTAHLKNGLIALIVGVFSVIAGAVGLVVGTVRQTRRTAEQAVQITQAGRRDRMAQRAAAAELRPTVVEDPLRAQNRALSAFAVLLLVALIAVVIWQTSGDGEPDAPVGIAAGSWEQSRSTAVPTAIFPTPIPTATPVPDPLRVGGSLVFTLRTGGQTDLWVLGVGETEPLRLTNHPADDRDPAWSPDGTRVAFTSRRDGNWELYVLEVETNTISRLTYTPGFEGAPTWSPDGAFIAYEGYNEQTQNLDIYIISSDPEIATRDGAVQMTMSPAPDTEPAWSPLGRQIAYVTWRNGNQEIVIFDLDNPNPDREQQATNLTQTPDINETHPVWSHDGTRIAYTATVNGVEGVGYRYVDQPGGESVLIGRGKMPAWAPNDASVLYMFEVNRRTQLIAKAPDSFGAASDATTLPGPAEDPDWTSATLPVAFVQSGGLPPNPQVSDPPYVEDDRPQTSGLYGLALLNGVTAPLPRLSSRVNESFEAFRMAVLDRAGYDFLGTLEDAFWPQGRPPEAGEPADNWHYTGRAIAIPRDLIYLPPPAPIEVVREDIEVNTFWRVYVRVPEELQGGAFGEPLRDLPWDFTARSSGSPEDYERGGRLKDLPPAGYYIDLTEIAADYGWERVPAQRTWQHNFGAIQFWELRKSDGLSWRDAMLELYTPEELDAFLAGATSVPAPPPLPTQEPTAEVQRTPTPIPPDLQ